MAFDLRNMSFQTRKVVKESQFAVGGVIPIATEKPLKRVLSVVATPTMARVESVDFNHNMRGKINIEMLYLTESGEYETTKAEFSFEHTENVAVENANCKAEIAEYSVVEETATYVKLNFLTNLYLEGTSVDNLTALDGEENNYVVLNGDFDHVSYLQGAKSQAELEDKIELDGAQKILGYETAIKTGAVSCGIDQIGASGEVCVKLSCLTEDSVVCVERQLEFNHEVACLGVNPEDLAKAIIYVSKVEYAFVDSEKPTIALKFFLDIDVSAYRKQTEKVIGDLFCTTKEVEVVTECANFTDYIGQKEWQEEISCEDVLESEQNVVCARVVGTNIAKLAVDNGKFVADGVAKVNMLVKDAEGDTITKVINIPFSICRQVETDGLVSEYHVQAMVKDVAKHEEKVELTLTFVFDLAFCKERYAEYVSSAKELADKEAQTSAITIYVASEGDTLFSVAKALSIHPDKIQNQNQVVDGKFEKGQRIFVYNPLVAEF